LQRE
jgi:hypothetical protein